MSDTIVKVQPYSVDLADPIKKTYLDTLFASQDNEADRFDISVFRDHAQEKLPNTATVSAYFIRGSDNATVSLTGKASGNVASVTLKKSCYNKSGQFALIIKVTIDGVISTVFYGEGTVFASVTDTILDEENVIPSLEDLLAQIAVMEKATAAANTATTNANTATSKANTATTNANNATTNANNAATAANTAADAANAAAKAWGDETAGDAAKLGGKAPEYYIQPRNLLDNSDFTNPVNQRGETSYKITVAGQYTIDRWLCSQAGTVVTLTDSGLSVAAVTAENFQQKVLTKGLAGKTVTFAMKVISSTNMTMGIRTVGWGSRVTASIPDNTSGIYTVTCTIPADTTDEYIRCTIWSTATGAFSAELEWAALYEGEYTADTLPPYILKGYGAEQAECKRYFQRLGENSLASTFGFGIIQSSADKYVRIFVPLPQELRANPTVTLSGTLSIVGYSPSGAIATTAESIVSAYATNNGAEIVMVSTDAIVANSHYLARMNSNSYLNLSADL